jgi:hypothetical protein
MYTNFAFHEQLFNYPYENFKKHLIKEGNNRILFSGKFRIGKSFFLTHFFDEATQQDKESNIAYETFHILNLSVIFLQE